MYVPIHSTKPAACSEFKEETVIGGQAVRLPGDINSAESLLKSLIDQRDDIMTLIPEARWDHKSFYRSPDSKEPPAPCAITLEKPDLLTWQNSTTHSSAFFSAKASPHTFHWKLLSKLWKTPTCQFQRSKAAIWVSLLRWDRRNLFADKDWAGLCFISAGRMVFSLGYPSFK